MLVETCVVLSVIVCLNRGALELPLIRCSYQIHLLLQLFKIKAQRRKILHFNGSTPTLTYIK
jgi:hypothetical protein